MRSIALALLLAALLVVQITLRSAGVNPLLFAPVAVVIGIAAATAAQGGINWIAAGLGAASSLALVWLDPWSPTLALTVMCSLWLLPRAWLAINRTHLAVAAVSLVAASTIAAVVVVRYASSPLVMHIASCVFAGAALAMATLAGRADSPLLHSLRVSALAAHEPVRGLLEKTVTLVFQRKEAPTDSDAIPSPRWQRKQAKLIARLGDQIIAQMGFQGEEAQRQRLELEDRLKKAVALLETGEPKSTSTTSKDAVSAPPAQVAPTVAESQPTAEKPSETQAQAPTPETAGATEPGEPVDPGKPPVAPLVQAPQAAQG